MNVSEIFIRRPIATSLLMLAIAFFGVVAYRALPVSDLPTVDSPSIRVQAGLPGGDPGSMAATVASPIERQLTTIAGIDSMTSQSGTGNSEINMQFDLGRSMDSAVVDVQTALSAVMPLLPAGMPNPPTFRKQNPSDQDIMQLSLTSSSLSMSVLDDYAETVLAPRISMISGVSQVQVNGAQKYAVRVQVDPDKLRAQQIGINEVDQALQNWNANLPTGQLFGPHQTFNIKAAGQLNNAAQFRPIVLAYRQGRPVRLDQVATVLDSVENTRTAAWFYTREGGRRAINMGVQRQPGINIIEVTDAVRAVLPQLEAQLPPSVHLQVRQDRSRTIRKAFADIQWTMLITLVLVVGVIYAFLHNGSATLIPALALPFSILGTFAVMKLLNFSLNNLSMMALILSVGFIVDDAIVMLENIVRHIEAGEDRLTASLKGSKEIGFTILTMTTSLAAVFIPILFMSGILGRLFREFAVTITSAILISGLVSITLTPMLCSRFLRVVHAKKGLAGLLDRAFDAVFAGYRWSLGLVLRHRFAMVIVFVAVLAGTVRMYSIVPKGFIPDQDQDFLFVNLQAAQGTSFPDMSLGALRAAEIIKQNPYIDSFNVNLGGGGNFGGGGSSNAQIQVQLLPRAQRPRLGAADRAAAAAAAVAVPQLPGVRQNPAGAADRLRPGQQQLQRDGAERRHRPAVHLVAAPEHGDGDGDPGDPGRLEQPRDQKPEGEPRHRSRQGGGRRAERDADPELAVRRIRAEVVVHDLRRHDAVPGAARARSEIPGVRRFAGQALVQDAPRRAHPAAGGRVGAGNRRPAEHQPLGPASRR